MNDNPVTEDTAAKKVAYGIYTLYLASTALPTLLVVGIILAYVFRNDAKVILISHYQYLIRTFWIGLLYFGISVALIPALVGMALIPICIIWWVIRIAIGLKSLMHNEAITNPKTWVF